MGLDAVVYVNKDHPVLNDENDLQLDEQAGEAYFKDPARAIPTASTHLLLHALIE